MPRSRSSVAQLFCVARIATDVSAVSSGNPSRIVRRGRNKALGQALGRGGFWRLLWGGGGKRHH